MLWDSGKYIYIYRLNKCILYRHWLYIKILKKILVSSITIPNYLKWTITICFLDLTIISRKCWKSFFMFWPKIPHEFVSFASLIFVLRDKGYKFILSYHNILLVCHILLKNICKLYINSSSKIKIKANLFKGKILQLNAWIFI